MRISLFHISFISTQILQALHGFNRFRDVHGNNRLVSYTFIQKKIYRRFFSSPSDGDESQIDKTERIAKFIARAGVCSRRDAEKLILEGRVAVDGTIINTPAFLVNQANRIEVDNKLVEGKKDTRVWCYYKPVGYITTHSDPQGRPTVFDDLKQYNLPRVISIGRLDINSEGLLLLTNNGEFARHAELPSTAWQRVYRVRVFGFIDKVALQELRNGITVDGINYGSMEVEIELEGNKGVRFETNIRKSNVWLRVTLREGKNREIRKVMNYIGLEVSRLIRLNYGPFELGSLKPHQIKEMMRKTTK